MNDSIGIVYLVAGLSSRFGGKPKPLQVIRDNGKTFIEESVDQAVRAGFTHLFFVTSPKTRRFFEKIFRNNYRGLPVRYSIQDFDNLRRNKPWGQTDALCTLHGKIDMPFVVLNGDDLYGEKGLKILCRHLAYKPHEENNICASIWYRLKDVLPSQGTVNRGIYMPLEKGQNYWIKETSSISWENLLEKGLEPNSKCSMGIFALYPSILDHLKQDLENFKKVNFDNPSIELPLGEALSKLITEKKSLLRVYPSLSKWVGITNPEDLEVVRKHIILQSLKQNLENYESESLNEFVTSIIEILEFSKEGDTSWILEEEDR